MNNQRKTLTEKIFIILFLIFFSIFMYMEAVGFEKIADKKSTNPKYMIKGCLFYVKSKSDKYGYEILILNVDGYKRENRRIYSRSSNAYANKIKFEEYIKNNPNTCHSVGYVKVNLILTSKIYIYEYYGNFS